MDKRVRSVVLATGLIIATAAGPMAGVAQAEDPLAGSLTIWDTGILGRTLEGGEPDLENSFIDQMALKFEAENPGVDVTVVQQGDRKSTRLNSSH